MRSLPLFCTASRRDGAVSWAGAGGASTSSATIPHHRLLMNSSPCASGPARSSRPSLILARRAVAAFALLACGLAGAACPPGTSTKLALQILKQVEWKVADDNARQALALALLDCLASPDPELRDGVAFDAIAHWARAKSLTPATLQTIRTTLLPRLLPDADAAGFGQPFAA